MIKRAIDFMLILDGTERVKDVKVFNTDLDEKVFKVLLEKPLKLLMPIDSTVEAGMVEYNNMLYVYQWLDKHTLCFSQKTMESLLFQKALDQLEEGIHVYDKQGYGVYINEASSNLGSLDKMAFKGRHLIDLYQLDEDYSTVLTTLREKKPVRNRCDLFATKDNKPMMTINSAYPIVIDDVLCGAILTENNIETLKKQAHKTLYLNDYMYNTEGSKMPSEYYRFKDIVYSSDVMKDLIHVSKKIALNDSAVLIYGETGTGKELLAQSIHTFGKTDEKPFVAVNCAAIPEHLAESLFFGTVKGAYTGSINNEGFFSQANGGTLFLDEVNSMSLEMQSKLLRALQNKTYRKVGSQKEQPFNVRIMAASNEDLYKLMQQKKLRSDFYYRISTMTLNLPSLRERKEDIVILVNHFIQKLNAKYMKQMVGLAEDVRDLFHSYDWFGNVREMENVMEYAYALVTDDERVLKSTHFPKYLNQKEPMDQWRNNAINEAAKPTDLEQAMQKFEKQFLIEQLDKNQWNVSKTAQALKIKRQSLQYRMKKYNITTTSAK